MRSPRCRRSSRSADPRINAVLRASRTSLRLVVGGTPILEAGDPVPRPRPLPLGLSTFTHDGARIRAYVTELRDPNLGGLARLEVATRLLALERRQSRLRERLALLGAIAVLVAAIGVFLATSLVLRPVRRLRSATANIAGDEDLARRVPADDGPTELRELAGAFNAMLARLGRSSADRERALEATRRFAADAGHELRTPLTSAQATLSALARHPELDPERRTAMAEDALEAHHRLVALLDGLQLLARGDAAAANAPVDLTELADSLFGAASERHPAITWTSELPDAPVVIDGWEPGLRSLIDNLLENAVRHGRGDGHVHFALTGGPALELTVEDDGPGIDDALRESLFEPFRRGEDREHPGSGLGLAIVAQQVAHHDATITVDRSERLGGARFSVRFGPGQSR